jgi:surface polysaccharide O-acyltransferase-like enzyme
LGPSGRTGQVDGVEEERQEPHLAEAAGPEGSVAILQLAADPAHRRPADRSETRLPGEALDVAVRQAPDVGADDERLEWPCPDDRPRVGDDRAHEPGERVAHLGHRDRDLALGGLDPAGPGCSWLIPLEDDLGAEAPDLTQLVGTVDPVRALGAILRSTAWSPLRLPRSALEPTRSSLLQRIQDASRGPPALTVTATTPAPAHAAAPLASRRVDVELARVVAIVMVMTIHVAAGTISLGLAAHSQSGTYLAAIALNAFSRPGAPVFLAIAGWALLKRRPVSDEDVWLGRRMIRLLVPLGLWGLLYIGAAVVRGAIYHTTPWLKVAPGDWLLRQLTLTIAGPGVRPHLWFMYTLAGLTLAIWLARAIPRELKLRPTIVYAAAGFALLMLFGLPAPFVAPYLQGFVWTLGYAALGYVALEADTPPFPIALALYVAASLLLVFAGLTLDPNSWAYSYPGPLTVAATIGLLWVIRGVRVPQRVVPMVLSAAGLSFGVYLGHLLVADYVGVISSTPGALLYGLSRPANLAYVLAATMLLSFGVAWLWHRSRKLSFLLG